MGSGVVVVLVARRQSRGLQERLHNSHDSQLVAALLWHRIGNRFRPSYRKSLLLLQHHETPLTRINSGSRTDASLTPFCEAGGRIICRAFSISICIHDQGISNKAGPWFCQLRVRTLLLMTIGEARPRIIKQSNMHTSSGRQMGIPFLPSVPLLGQRD